MARTMQGLRLWFYLIYRGHSSREIAGRVPLLQVSGFKLKPKRESCKHRDLQAMAHQICLGKSSRG